MRPDIGDYAVIFGLWFFVAVHVIVGLGLIATQLLT